MAKTFLRSAARKIGMDPSNLSKLARDYGIPIHDERTLMTLGREHQREPWQTNRCAIDLKTGLSLRESLLKERVRALKRENDAKEREFDNSWLPSEWVIRKFTLFCDRLELVPGRVKSRIGLSEEHRAVIQKIIDEIRREYADQELVVVRLEKVFADGDGI